MSMENLGQANGRFLTLASPASPVSLAPSFFQVWRRPNSERTTARLDPSDQNLAVPKPSDGRDDPGFDKNDVDFEAELGLVFRLRNINTGIDPKKLKRIVSNRVSAQKSRLKKLQYVSHLENMEKQLEMEVSLLASQVALFIKQIQLLEIEKRDMNQRIASFQDNALTKQGEIEENYEEIKRLRQKLMRQHDMAYTNLGEPNSELPLL